MTEKEKVDEYLSDDDLAYLKDTIAEVQSLQTSANTLLNFAQGRLAKKYKLALGEEISSETGLIVRRNSSPSTSDPENTGPQLVPSQGTSEKQV